MFLNENRKVSPFLGSSRMEIAASGKKYSPVSLWGKQPVSPALLDKGDPLLILDAV